MKKISIAIVSTSLALISLNGFAGSRLDDAKMILVGENQVKSILKDPNSASFKNQFIGNQGHPCGEVNSKNGFGGYTGFRRYAVAGVGIVAIEGENLNTSDFSSIWASYCRK